ncbi:hypothetical protein HYH02_013345 [Chlamydomonas schloesseri]|uniref:EF-hand domain-containing protein n=1 Tax=Chlamydomonas schloesseri TaxID=2026947 RepID=A0A835ST31_9CHLO|nr:hypothetical protein HYH02_013345 [Chlamydomonas schloesseri]|eukprot:KAG2431356.1 hypothetical protein HYH02_013345 [Chlamydomonas schloesseri]
MGLFSCFAARPAPDSPREASLPVSSSMRVPPNMVGKVASGRSTAPAVAPTPAAQLPPAASTRKQVSLALPDPDDDIDVGPATRNHVDQTPKKTKPAALKATAAQAAADQDCDVAPPATDAGTFPAATSASIRRDAAAAASGSPSAEAPVSPLAGMNARVPSKVVRNLSAPVLTLADIAGLLGRFTGSGGDSDAAAVTAYLSAVLAGSKAQGAGLYEAARAQPEAGKVFAAAYRLAQVAGQVVPTGPCRDNGAVMAGLGQDVVRALDAAGKKGCVPPRETLADVAVRLDTCSHCLSVYAKEGWLLHLACNEAAKADLDRAHNAVVAALQAVAPGPSGLELPVGSSAGRPGAYLDMNRGLRRSLKTHGSGSVAAGLKAVGTDPLSPELTKLAALLGVSAAAVARELAALPADVPADVYYSRMVLSLQQQRTLFGSAAGADATASLVERYRPIFAHYDKAGKGYLEAAELRAVLGDLSEAGAGGAGPTGPELERAFALADQDGDGRVNPEEFARYYDALTFGHARKQLRLAMGLQAENDLKALFRDFASFGTRQQVEEMDSAHFAKLFRDCGLLGPDLTLTDIDLAFTAAKGKGERKLSFDAFLTALATCAERKGCGLEGLVRSILGSEGPLARATKADAVRLHDDKSTYTGVYAKGGPKVAEKAHDLAALLDRSDAGAKKTPVRASRAGPITIVDKPADKPPLHHTPPPAHAPGAHSQSMRLSMGPGGVPAASVSAGGAAPSANNAAAGGSSWKRRSTAGGSGSVTAPSTSTPLYESWLMWQQFGAGAVAGAPSRTVEMGPAQYVKLLRETGIISGKDFTAVQAELIYAKVKPQGCTKITYECFERALALIAAAKGTPREALEAAITASGGPLLTPCKH